MPLEYTEKLEEEYPKVDELLDEIVGKLIGDTMYYFDVRLDPNDLGAITYEALAKWVFLSFKNEERRQNQE
jgi:hypothetical protein